MDNICRIETKDVKFKNDDSKKGEFYVENSNKNFQELFNIFDIEKIIESADKETTKLSETVLSSIQSYIKDLEDEIKRIQEDSEFSAEKKEQNSKLLSQKQADLLSFNNLLALIKQSVSFFTSLNRVKSDRKEIKRILEENMNIKNEGLFSTSEEFTFVPLNKIIEFLSKETTTYISLIKEENEKKQKNPLFVTKIKQETFIHIICLIRLILLNSIRISSINELINDKNFQEIIKSTSKEKNGKNEIDRTKIYDILLERIKKGAENTKKLSKFLDKISYDRDKDIELKQQNRLFNDHIDCFMKIINNLNSFYDNSFSYHISQKIISNNTDSLKNFFHHYYQLTKDEKDIECSKKASNILSLLEEVKEKINSAHLYTSYKKNSISSISYYMFPDKYVIKDTIQIQDAQEILERIYDIKKLIHDYMNQYKYTDSSCISSLFKNIYIEQDEQQYCLEDKVNLLDIINFLIAIKYETGQYNKNFSFYLESNKKNIKYSETPKENIKENTKENKENNSEKKNKNDKKGEKEKSKMDIIRQENEIVQNNSEKDNKEIEIEEVKETNKEDSEKQLEEKKDKDETEIVQNNNEIVQNNSEKDKKDIKIEEVKETNKEDSEKKVEEKEKKKFFTPWTIGISLFVISIVLYIVILFSKQQKNIIKEKTIIEKDKNSPYKN